MGLGLGSQALSERLLSNANGAAKRPRPFRPPVREPRALQRYSSVANTLLLNGVDHAHAIPKTAFRLRRLNSQSRPVEQMHGSGYEIKGDSWRLSWEPILAWMSQQKLALSFLENYFRIGISANLPLSVMASHGRCSVIPKPTTSVALDTPLINRTPWATLIFPAGKPRKGCRPS